MATEILYGINTAEEILKAGRRRVVRLLISRNEKSQRVNDLADLARERTADRNMAVESAVNSSVERDHARVQRDAAIGIAANEAAEKHVIEADRNRIAMERNDAALQRDAAFETAHAEAANASNANLGLYTLLGIIVIAVIVFMCVYFNRSSDVQPMGHAGQR